MTSSLSSSRLEALLESAQLLHSSLETGDLLKHLLRSVMGRLVVTRGLVAVDDDGTLRIAHVRGFKGLTVGQSLDDDLIRTAGVQVVVPIGDPGRPLGVIGLGSSATGAIDAAEHDFLHALSGIAASSLANARVHAEVRALNRRLDQNNHELRTMLELVSALTATVDAEEVAQLLGLTLAGRWAVSRYVVAAFKPGHPAIVRQKGLGLNWSLPWIDELNTLQASTISALPPSPLADALRAERLSVVFPLRSGDRAIGFAGLGARPAAAEWTEADLSFGAGLAAQAAVALENAWHVRDLMEKKQIERELSLAASIQQGLFPSSLPPLERFELAAASRPARQVGGDYYDAITVDAIAGQRCLCCVADVSGKGVAASILMSNMQATLRALLGREASLAELARCTNDLLYSSTPGNKYVTAILLAIDPSTGGCQYVNGGHTEGLVLRASKEIERLPATGLALGLFPGMTYDEIAFTTGPGDLVLLYSDGVTEALDENGNEFEVERLIDSLQRASDRPAQRIVEAVLADLDAFVGDAPQYDDITLLVVKRL